MCEQCVWCRLKMHVYSILNSVGMCVCELNSECVDCVCGVWGKAMERQES